MSQQEEGMVTEEVKEAVRGSECEKSLKMKKANSRRCAEETFEERRRKHSERVVQRRKEKREGMTDEELKEYRRKLAIKTRERRQKLKEENPELWKDQLSRERFNRVVKLASMSEDELKDYKFKRYFGNQAYMSRKKSSCGEKENENGNGQQKNNKCRRNFEGEERERYLKSLSRAQKKYYERVKRDDPEKMNAIFKKMNQYQREQTAKETPEQRQKRLQRYKIYREKAKLKKKLEENEIDPEEIQRRMEELAETLRKEPLPPLENMSQYKPQLRARKQKKSALVHPDGSTASLPISSSENVQFQYYCVFVREPQPPQQTFQIQNIPGNMSPAQPLPQSPTLSMISTPEEDDICNVENNHSKIPASSPPPQISCQYCDTSFPSSTPLREHMQLNHSEKCWKCPLCNQVMLSPQELQDHFQHSHKNPQELDSERDKQYKCDSKVFPFICIRCPVNSQNFTSNRFKTRNELWRHVRIKHPESYWPCMRCNLLKYSKYAYEQHFRLCRQ